VGYARENKEGEGKMRRNIVRGHSLKGIPVAEKKRGRESASKMGSRRKGKGSKNPTYSYNERK